MAQNKKSFLLYSDLIHTVEKMPVEKAGELFLHILRYVNDQDPKTDDLIIELTFEPIKQSLKRDLEKWEYICNRNKINGSKGGRPKTQDNPDEPTGLFGNPDNPDEPDNDNGSVSGSVSGSGTDKEVNIFIQKDHLSITWDEMNKLTDEFGEVKADEMIRRVLNYRKNTKYKSLYLTALNWLKKEKEEQPTTGEKLRPKLSA